MKITKQKLKEIIKEELEAVMEKEVVSELFGFGNKLKKLSDDEVWKGMKNAIAGWRSDQSSKATKMADKWIEEYRRRHLAAGTKIEDVNDTVYKLQYSKKDSGTPEPTDASPDQPRKYNKPWSEEDMASWRKKKDAATQVGSRERDRLRRIGTNHPG
jgi:hypothetical protein